MMASVHCFFSFYIFGHFFTIYLCRFALLEVLLSKLENIFFLIELKDKLLHYNKITSLCHWIALLDNNNMFPKNAFLNLEIFLKNIFEKYWHQHSRVVKMNSLSYLSIVQSDNFLETYFSCILNNVTIKLKNSWKSLFSWYLSKKILTPLNFH